MKTTLLIFMMLLSFPLLAQEEEAGDTEEQDQQVENTHIYTYGITNPEPEVGILKFYKALDQEMKYPKEAKKSGIQGRVYVQFVVEKNGELTNFSVVRGIGGGCDEEAVRALKKVAASSNGKWKPGIQSGDTVRSRYTFPVTFNPEK